MRPNVVFPIRSRFLVTAAALALASGAAVPAAAQAPEQPQKPTTAEVSRTAPKSATDIPMSPEELARLRKAVETPSVLTSDTQLARFYLEVVAPQSRYIERIFQQDLMNGPVPGAGMTHQEFLNMVTPRELYGSAGISVLELLQGAVFNWAAHKGVEKLKDWREAREAARLQAIRLQIERELAATRGNGGGH
jgi:hypothetical protein